MELNPNFDTTYEPKTLNDIVFTQRYIDLRPGVLRNAVELV